ncbi:probable ascorbate-specific transmembrane electron transporter 1 [Phoenix dactylifera]|uniref:Probable ascorbate-specific transmembrane electron transporter 1 n=1 Tax=Phoenix dactylifera TaxID=42345 RepID=A0A8B7BYG3_PHODC|nr:probable ascorbate-specific transmembrane electron transporter 1 [Phoenix dactylifera]
MARPEFLVAASRAGMAAHVLALTAAILVLVWVLHFGGGAHLHSENKKLIFNVHPLVMTLGFILVIGEGIMAYKTVRAVRPVQKCVHLLLHLVALTLGIFGVYVAFKYHRESLIPDMYTLHSWLGMCTICLFGLQWLFGFLFFWYPQASLRTREMVVPIHVSAGLAIFFMTICTAETGFVQRGTEPGPETRLINFTGLIILLFGLAVSISVVLPRVM